MHLQDYDTAIRYVAHVLGNQPLTSDGSQEEVREITFEVAEHGFAPRVGQNIGVLAPGANHIGQTPHFRLYSIADVPRYTQTNRIELSICVRRCNYIDEYSGEEYRGIASNYLCDLSSGDALTVTGPYGPAFQLPADSHATLVMIGAGTGIAPFRAFVKHIYNECKGFKGRVLLFHGATSGLEMLYRNDQRDDFGLYYDQGTFEAINVLSKRPAWTASIDWHSAIEARAEQLVELLTSQTTHVYVAGLTSIIGGLEDVLAQIMTSADEWKSLKSELKSEHRWNELLYD